MTRQTAIACASFLVAGVLAAVGVAGCGRVIGLDSVSCAPCVHRNDPVLGTLLERARRDDPAIPGIAVALIIDDDIYLAVRGVRDTITNTPLEETDAFPLWLSTTSLTGALLAKEVDSGVLTWDTTLNDVFPEMFAGTAQPAYAGVTVRELASHTAGLSSNSSAALNHVGNAANDYASEPSRIVRRYNYTRDSLQDAPLYAPGTTSSLAPGHVLAVAMLEALTQTPYETLIQQQLFVPLGMTHSKWTPDVVSYSFTQSPVAYSAVELRSPELGVCQSIEDLARFAYMTLMRPGAPRYYSDAANQALRTTAKASPMTPAFGVAADNLAGGAEYGIAGSTGAAYSDLDIRPNRREAIMMLTNYTGDASGNIGTGAQLVLDQLKGQVETYFPQVPLPSFPDQFSPTYHAQQDAVQATAVSGPGYEAIHAFDGDYSTSWAAGDGVTDATLTVSFATPTTVTSAVMNEVGPLAVGNSGSRYGITRFDLSLDDGVNAPYLAASGDHIGPNLAIPFQAPYAAIKSATLRLQGTSLALTEFHLLP